MAEHTRLSELTGIADEEDDLATFWGLNVALFLLGAAVVAVAFYFLDATEKRLLYNPWTYVVLTPILMTVVSGVMSTVVSRVIEKSMQLALLLSVLVHLLMLVYATNIVIFSRVWPDMLESIAKQRQELKRQALQANQYYEVSKTNQVGRRPDYLTYVPTQHQPTEVEDTESPALELARSEVPNLVSPSPDIQLANNPHLIERKESSPSASSTRELAASLSRSALEQRLESQSFPQQVQLPPDEVMAELAPSELAAARKAKSSIELPENTALPQAMKIDASTALKRARAIESSPTQLNPLFPAYEKNAGRPTPAPSTTRANVTAPSVALDRQSPTPSPSQTAGLSGRSANRGAGLLANPVDSSAPAAISPSKSLERADRNTPDLRMPQTQVGSHSVPLVRSSAGGVTGPPASSSMPVFGADVSLGGRDRQAEVTAADAPARRRPNRSRGGTPLSLPGQTQAPVWENVQRFAPGGQGSSSSSIARRSTAGAAASSDVAQLSGEGGAIQRTRVGPSAMVGPPSVPSPQEQAELLADIGPQAGASSLDRRESMANASSPALQDIAMSSKAMANGSPRLELERETNWAPDAALASSQVAGSIERALDYSTGPVAGQVEVPSGDLLASEAPPLDIDPDQTTVGQADMQRRGTGRSELAYGGPAASTLLKIDGPLGIGGLAPTATRPGVLLPRRDMVSENMTPVDLETRRFSRKDIGGRLAGGQEVVIPKPAFQQRMDRLKDRDPLDETSIEPQTELAIERGLEFLANNQREDGSWRLQDFDTPVLMRSDTAATALAVLSFQGAGYTHKQFKYADVVGKALRFLMSRQTRQGDLYIPQDPASDQNAKLYSHAIAALAMCEAYGMTQDEELRASAQAALTYMTISQDPRRGGWRYQPGVGSDTSVTGWFMMAFKSGQLAGLDVAPETFTKIRRYLDACRVSEEEPYLFRYNPFALNNAQQRHGLKPTAVMTSVGLLMRLYFGWQRDTSEMMAGTDYLLQYIPQHGTRSNSLRDTYYWYYATQVMFHMGGERWDRWHDALYPLLIDNQVVDGEYAGSWNPISPTPDLWARYGGRLYVTTLNLLSLEVSYRHLPLYEATAE